MSAQPHSIRVLLVDARPVVLKGLDDLINAQQPAMQAIGQASTYPHALDQADRLRPDVALFSFFPDALDPLDVISTLVMLGAIKVLVLKGLYDNLCISKAIEAGARGVVLAEDPTDAITRAIFNVHHHDIAADRAWTGGLSGYAKARPTHLNGHSNGHTNGQTNGHLNGDSDDSKIAHLTQRERELIDAIVSNPSAKYISIADRLHISEHTVHNHLSNIYSYPYAASRLVPGRYIVVFKPNVSNPVAATAQALNGTGGQLHHTYSNAIKGFAVSLPAAALPGVRNNPNVLYVEQDQTVALKQVTSPQSSATWGLDRIDQTDLPLSGQYTFNNSGAGVTAFIIDTGIRADHAEFSGRVGVGYNAIPDTNGTNDCNGHGTHVSGTVGGSTWGVAKAVTLIPVRVLDCTGSGSWSGVIAGIDWVAGSPQRPAVANLSLGVAYQRQWILR